jgi:hypothetical protein
VRAAAVCLVALVVSGCGQPEKPKAPKTAVTNAVNGIVTPCGEAYMVLAGGGRVAAQLRRLDAAALPAAGRLVALAHRQPQAVYLGTSLATLVRGESATAAGCRLTRTARRLR